MLNIKYTLSGNRTIISIGHKYNYSKVIYLFAKYDAGTSTAGTTYLSK